MSELFDSVRIIKEEICICQMHIVDNAILILMEWIHVLDPAYCRKRAVYDVVGELGQTSRFLIFLRRVKLEEGWLGINWDVEEHEAVAPWRSLRDRSLVAMTTWRVHPLSWSSKVGKDAHELFRF